MSKRKKNYRNKTRMSREEKQLYNQILKERNYIREELGIGKPIFEVMKMANQGIIDEIFAQNVKNFVYQMGKGSNIVETIKELREKDVNIHFVEENLDTRHRRNDLLVGILIGKAIYQMAIEREVIKDGKE